MIECDMVLCLLKFVLIFSGNKQLGFNRSLLTVELVTLGNGVGGKAEV